MLTNSLLIYLFIYLYIYFFYSFAHFIKYWKDVNRVTFKPKHELPGYQIHTRGYFQPL